MGQDGPSHRQWLGLGRGFRSMLGLVGTGWDGVSSMNMRSATKLEGHGVGVGD